MQMMFNKLWKTKAEVDKNLEQYFKDKLEILEIKHQAEVEKRRAAFTNALADLRAENNMKFNDLATEYGKKMLEKNVELAKLDALIEARKENSAALQQLIRDKDRMIEGLLEAVKTNRKTP